jgi:hypothetical protein
MFVSDQDGGQVFGGAPDGGKSVPDLTQAEPCIYQDAGLACFKVGTIPARTASQNGQTNRHDLP